MEECVSDIDVTKTDHLEHDSEAHGVISLLLTKPDDDPLQVQFSDDGKGEIVSGVCDSRSAVATISVAKANSCLNMSQISLTDADILLETGDAIQHVLNAEASAIQLESGTSTFVQNLAVTDESDSCDGSAKFIDGQAVRLEDGSTAFIHSVPREGLQAVQLEDGTMAYLSQTRDELFNGEASGLDLEHLSSPPLSAENSEDKDNVKMTAAETNPKSSRSGASGEKSFKCPYQDCNRVYTTPHHLKVHERSHTGDRPFKCTAENCGKAFATGYGLKSHTRVHTGETPYKCTSVGCLKAFKTSGDLQKHLRTHTGERPFKCPYTGCERAFTTSNIRKVHMRTHTGERPYICDVCGRAFASATNFKNHVRIHTGEKPYVCNFQGCNKKFTEYSSLYKHNVVHTRDKPYICTLCGKHYRQTSTLAMHKRSAHDILETNEDEIARIIPVTEDKLDQEDACGKTSNIIELKLGTGFEETTNILIEKDTAEEAAGVETLNKRFPTIIALQADELMSEHAPMYAVQLHQDGGVSSMQQILLLTDSTQLAALQQVAQVHLHTALPRTEVTDKGD